MPAAGARWAAILVLLTGLAALGPARATDESPAPPPPQGTATVKDEAPPSPAEPTPAAPQRPAVKPPPGPPTQSRPRQDFRPSEEIHVDKAVDFPADI
jgi:hypothetical protein